MLRRGLNREGVEADGLDQVVGPGIWGSMKEGPEIGKEEVQSGHLV